jgi:glycine/D-amino acid oxidase-like deaminating enzyme
MELDRWDAIIVGGGGAGLSAALTLVRARRRVLVIDAGEPRNGVAAHMHGVLAAGAVAAATINADLVQEEIRQALEASG